MKMYVGVTDYEWFQTLKKESCEEINFWRPSGRSNFKALNEGDLFLFKLHSPNNYIVGGGIFLKFSILPTSLAWEAFGIANGANSLLEFRERVYKYRKTNKLSEPDPNVGCIILSNSFYFDESDWIPVPENWKANIVQGKTYSTDDPFGAQLYKRVLNNLQSNRLFEEKFIKENHQNQYGKEQRIKPRIGQGAFKVLITDAYQRRCAITGEKTLPVLEAAHIKPYSLNGPHKVNNGLLLRRDLHTLFDRGYITIDEDFTIHVSKRIKEDYGNGKEYYAHHGKKLVILPNQKEDLPDKNYLEWHNETIFLG